MNIERYGLSRAFLSGLGVVKFSLLWISCCAGVGVKDFLSEVFVDADCIPIRFTNVFDSLFDDAEDFLALGFNEFSGVGRVARYFILLVKGVEG